MRSLVVMSLVMVPLGAEGQEVPSDEFWPLPASVVVGTPASAADAAEIDELISRYSLAWGSEDVDGLMETYAPDAEWTNAYGIVLRGHGDLRPFLSEMFDHFDAVVANAEAASSRKLTVRYVGPTTAVVHTVTESRRTENRDGAEAPRRVHVTYVLEKQPEGWRIVHQMIMDARL